MLKSKIRRQLLEGRLIHFWYFVVIIFIEFNFKSFTSPVKNVNGLIYCNIYSQWGIEGNWFQIKWRSFQIEFHSSFCRRSVSYSAIDFFNLRPSRSSFFICFLHVYCTYISRVIRTFLQNQYPAADKRSHRFK